MFILISGVWQGWHLPHCQWWPGVWSLVTWPHMSSLMPVWWQCDGRWLPNYWTLIRTTRFKLEWNMRQGFTICSSIDDNLYLAWCEMWSCLLKHLMIVMKQLGLSPDHCLHQQINILWSSKWSSNETSTVYYYKLRDELQETDHNDHE